VTVENTQKIVAFLVISLVMVAPALGFAVH